MKNSEIEILQVVKFRLGGARFLLALGILVSIALSSILAAIFLSIPVAALCSEWTTEHEVRRIRDGEVLTSHSSKVEAIRQYNEMGFNS